MPAYDYQCLDCGAEIELVLKLSDYRNEICCPQCRGMATRIITKPILTCLPDKERKWGTSLYRKEGKINKGKRG